MRAVNELTATTLISHGNELRQPRHYCLSRASDSADAGRYNLALSASPGLEVYESDGRNLAVQSAFRVNASGTAIRLRGMTFARFRLGWLEGAGDRRFSDEGLTL